MPLKFRQVLFFCDVNTHTTNYQATALSKELVALSPEAQKRILQMVELMVKQEKKTINDCLPKAAQFFFAQFFFISHLSTHFFFFFYVLYYVLEP